MKKAALILIILLMSQAFPAQSNEKLDEPIIDLKRMVEMQVKKIREAEKMKTTEQQENIAGLGELTYSHGSNISGIKSTFLKFFIIVEGSLLVIMVLIYKRKKSAKEKEKVNIKENILKLRSETLLVNDDGKLSEVRKTLKDQPLNTENMGRSITKKAKKLSVAKGEVHLAAKINMLAGIDK